ncbi:MAG: hypothetical protein KID00_08665 [Clostridium argentinense]|uniref:Uncharacterized protein n=1 Tax=Clostridium faecium TaxID=2762223 RepID=A0ABR8YSX3_9CLOT|nr:MULTISPECIES: hypothetical protein [Clostridium]MBD8047346.1 hypothetical protein [Clostridium faecium]MBS5823918.1 hypothetical protein [Clostridium argentinense]MDU1350274.1 hypothetical protein [Clostridium argentinense]
MAFSFGSSQTITIDTDNLTDPSGTDYALVVVGTVTVTPTTGSPVVYNLSQQYTELPTPPMTLNVAYIPIKDATVTSNYDVSYVLA